MAATFNINAFMTDMQTVACVVRPQAVFSMLTRRVNVPPDCVAIVWGESGTPTVVASGRTIEAEECRKLLFVRTTPFDLEYEFTGLTSKDGYAIGADVGLSIGVGADRAEVIAFHKTIMGSAETLSPERLRPLCEPTIRRAVEAFVRGRGAAEVVAADASEAFDSLLAEEFKPWAFETGLALMSSARFAAVSSDFVESQSREKSAAVKQQRLDAERQQRERDRQRRESHLADLSATLEKLQAMAEKAPGTGAVELIQTFSPAERGGLYQALLMRPTASKTGAVLVVAGEDVLSLDPCSPDKPMARRSLPTALGPLRSVRTTTTSGGAAWLVGSRKGVHLVTPGDVQSYAFESDRELRGGVNAAMMAKDHLFATHSEVGLVRWPRVESGPFELLLKEPLSGCKSIRDVQMDGAGRVWLAADRKVLGLTGDSGEIAAMLEAPANVTAMLVADESVIAGLADGRIVRWLFGAYDRYETLRHASGRSVESLAWLEGGGAARLLVGDRQPHLEMLVLGDAFSVEYRCGQPVRWGHAAADWVVGVNDRRDQLILWRTDTPQEPERIVHIGQLCGHSIQDVGLVLGRS